MDYYFSKTKLFTRDPRNTSTTVPSRLVHLDVENRFKELLTPALLCHKEPAQGMQNAPMVLYGIRERQQHPENISTLSRAKPRDSSINESGPGWCQHQPINLSIEGDSREKCVLLISREEQHIHYFEPFVIPIKYLHILAFRCSNSRGISL